MSIIVTCPSCAQKLRTLDSFAGRKIKCSKCGTAVAVPGRDEEASESTRREPEVPPANQAEPPIRRPKPPPAAIPVWEEDDRDTLRSSRKAGGNGSRAVLWFALGVGVFVLVLAAFGVFWASRTRQPVDPFNLFSPSALTEKQEVAAVNAISALGKVEAAVQVGVNFQQYSQLVIDAKAAVNDAERTLPACEMLTNLTEAMTAYKDAATVWNHKIQFQSLGLQREFGYGEIIDRYHLRMFVPEASAIFPELDRREPRASPDEAMQVIWAVAAEKLKAARSLQ